MVDRVLEKLKIFGLELDCSNYWLANLSLEESKQCIYNFCNITELFNKDLENIAVDMSVYNILKNQINSTNNDNNIKSISEGDISITYSNNDNTLYFNKQIKHLYNRLIRYRRLEW